MATVELATNPEIQMKVSALLAQELGNEAAGGTKALAKLSLGYFLAFLRNPAIRATIWRDHANGFDLVRAVEAEIARRLEEYENACVQIRSIIWHKGPGPGDSDEENH